MVALEESARSYNSFSGCDVRAIFHNKYVTELQSFTISITREKAPIYTMGLANPRAFSRGKRSIAGTLIFAMFDQDALLGNLANGSQPQRGQNTGGGNTDPGSFYAYKDEQSYSPNSLSAAEKINRSNTLIPATEFETQGSSFSGLKEAKNAWYVDQLRAFDISIAGANEYGQLMSMAVYGVELINTGMGVSIDDLMSEQQVTYVALGATPLMKVSSPSPA